MCGAHGCVCGVCSSIIARLKGLRLRHGPGRQEGWLGDRDLGRDRGNVRRLVILSAEDDLEGEKKGKDGKGYPGVVTGGTSPNPVWRQDFKKRASWGTKLDSEPHDLLPLRQVRAQA